MKLVWFSTMVYNVFFYESLKMYSTKKVCCFYYCNARYGLKF